MSNLDVNPAVIIAAARMSRAFSSWKGHILAPAGKKADREKTFYAMANQLIWAVVQDQETADKLLAQYFPQANVV